MSKSLGNGVDPMDVIDNYGADALRYYLTTDVSAGMDLKYDEDKVKSTWNFITNCGMHPDSFFPTLKT